VTETADIQFACRQYGGQQPGSRLIVTGAVHGNETCGTKAILRVLQQLEDGMLTVRRGSVTFVPVTNPLAFAKGERAGERNLNRNLFPHPNPQDFEDRVANWLCPLLAQHDVLLDLHSFNAAANRSSWSVRAITMGRWNLSSMKRRSARWRDGWACGGLSMVG